MRADPGQCNRLKREDKRHLGSEPRQPSTSGARDIAAPVKDAVAVQARSVRPGVQRLPRISAPMHAPSPLVAEEETGAGESGVSWPRMTPHTGTCMSPRRNEPSGYELGNQSLANLAVWIELPGETFVSDGVPRLFSLSCGVRHMMQVQGSLAVSPCGP